MCTKSDQRVKRHEYSQVTCITLELNSHFIFLEFVMMNSPTYLKRENSIQSSEVNKKN